MNAHKFTAIALASVLSLATVGCSTPKQTGQLVGGVIGLVAGGGIGSGVAAHVGGALLGGAVGYLIGGVIGNQFTASDHAVVAKAVNDGNNTTWTNGDSTYTVVPGPVVVTDGVETRTVEVTEKGTTKVETSTVEKRDGQWKKIRE